MKWSIYQTSNGRLIGRSITGTFPPARAAIPASDLSPAIPAYDPAGDFIAANLAVGESAYLGSADHRMQRIVGGQLVDRDPCPITSSVAGLVVTLSGVPLGAVVSVSGPVAEDIAQDDPDGSMEVTLPIGGSYRLSADLFPLVDYAETLVL